METTIRQATAADLDLPWMWAGELFDDAESWANLRAFLTEPGNQLFLAMQEDRIVGLVCGSVLRRPVDDPVLFLHALIVGEQGQGLARLLCRRLTTHARNAGCKLLWLAGEADIPASLDLFQGIVTSELRKIAWSCPARPRRS